VRFGGQAEKMIEYTLIRSCRKTRNNARGF
jgi:hypothetical protein